MLASAILIESHNVKYIQKKDNPPHLLEGYLFFICLVHADKCDF